jgi:hypothetical protein
MFALTITVDVDLVPFARTVFVMAPSCFPPTKWVCQRLSHIELLKALDFPGSVISILSLDSLIQLSQDIKNIHLKVIIHLADNLPHPCNVSLSTIHPVQMASNLICTDHPRSEALLSVFPVNASFVPSSTVPTPAILRGKET